MIFWKVKGALKFKFSEDSLVLLFWFCRQKFAKIGKNNDLLDFSNNIMRCCELQQFRQIVKKSILVIAIKVALLWQVPLTILYPSLQEHLFGSTHWPFAQGTSQSAENSKIYYDLVSDYWYKQICKICRHIIIWVRKLLR